MNYLLLMYHPSKYWTTGTEERDQLEEAGFAEFCGWLRENEIEWTSAPVDAPQTGQQISINQHGELSDALQDPNRVVSGYFLLSIPDESLIPELLRRYPRAGSTGAEIRRILS